MADEREKILVIHVQYPVLWETESREEQEQPRCSFHEDEADPCVYPCPYGMISEACPLKTCKKRQGGVVTG